MRIINGFCRGPVLSPAKLQSSVLPWVGYFFLTDCSRKTGTVLFILRAEAKEMCGQRLGGDNMTE